MFHQATLSLEVQLRFLTENLITMTIPAWIEKLIMGENYILIFNIIFNVPGPGERLKRT